MTIISSADIDGIDSSHDEITEIIKTSSPFPVSSPSTDDQ